MARKKMNNNSELYYNEHEEDNFKLSYFKKRARRPRWAQQSSQHEFSLSNKVEFRQPRAHH